MLIHKLTDSHCHFRQPPMSEKIIKYSAERCSHVIVMPNTIPPIHGFDQIHLYKDYYQKLAGECEVHMTAMLLPETTIADVIIAKKAGVVGFKLFPAGVTTNSLAGIPEAWLKNPPAKFVEVIKAIEDNDLVLLHHGELPSSEVFDREEDYLEIFQRFIDKFPNLRMSFEHVTTQVAVDTLIGLHASGARVRGTITLHHLEKNVNDLLGDKMRVDYFCKPILKSVRDQEALQGAVYEKAFMFGSDSAPHEIEHKHCSHACAGIFTAPVLLEALYQGLNILDEDTWNGFTYQRANEFYGFKDNDTIELVKEDWIVPEVIDNIIPYHGGETLRWKLKYPVITHNG